MQIDVENAERFDIDYVAEDGSMRADSAGKPLLPNNTPVRMSRRPTFAG